MRLWHLGVFIGALIGLLIIGSAVARRARWARYLHAVRLWRENRPAGRPNALAVVMEPDSHGDRNAAAWYLNGACHLREGRLRDAARAFGIAHHSNHRFESAALLTFACLKAAMVENPNAILDEIASTWQQMDRPAVSLTAEDRLVQDCLESTTRDMPKLSSVGRLAWLVVTPSLQAMIESTVEGSSAAWARIMKPEPMVRD